VGDAFCNRRLSYAGLTDEDGVVLGAAGQDLEHATDFLIAADDGVELAVAGLGIKVSGVFVQGFHRVLMAGAVGLPSLAQVQPGRLQRLGRDPGVLQDARCRAVDGEQGGEQGVEGDVLVSGLTGGFHGLAQDLLCGLAPGDIVLRLLEGGHAVEAPIGGLSDAGEADFEPVQQPAGEGVLSVEEGVQQVNRVHLGVPSVQREPLRFLQCGLGLEGKGVLFHISCCFDRFRVGVPTVCIRRIRCHSGKARPNTTFCRSTLILYAFLAGAAHLTSRPWRAAASSSWATWEPERVPADAGSRRR